MKKGRDFLPRAKEPRGIDGPKGKRGPGPGGDAGLHSSRLEDPSKEGLPVLPGFQVLRRAGGCWAPGHLGSCLLQLLTCLGLWTRKACEALMVTYLPWEEGI